MKNKVLRTVLCIATTSLLLSGCAKQDTVTKEEYNALQKQLEETSARLAELESLQEDNVKDTENATVSSRGNEADIESEVDDSSKTEDTKKDQKETASLEVPIIPINQCEEYMEEPEEPDGSAKLQLYEYGYVIDGNHLKIGAVIKNPNANYNVRDGYPNVVVYNEDGVIVETEEDWVADVAAGDTVCISDSFFLDDVYDNPTVEVTLNSNRIIKKDSDKHYLHSNNDFTFSNLNYVDDKITGVAINDSDEEAFVEIALVLKKDGKIVGSYCAGAEDVASGNKRAFTLQDSFFEMPDFDEAIISIVSW